jgi:hypothetical protein
VVKAVKTKKPALSRLFCCLDFYPDVSAAKCAG